MVEDAKGVSCETWRGIKQVLPGDKKSTVFFSIFKNGKWHTKKSLCRQTINQYFVSTGKALAKPFQHILTVSNSSTPSFKFHLNVTVNFVRNALRSLKDQSCWT